MSNFLIALMFTAGASTWIYQKLLFRTGNNTRATVLTTALLGLMIFFVIYTLAGLINPGHVSGR